MLAYLSFLCPTLCPHTHSEALDLQAYKKDLSCPEFYHKVSDLELDSKANQLLCKS